MVASIQATVIATELRSSVSIVAEGCCAASAIGFCFFLRDTMNFQPSKVFISHRPLEADQNCPRNNRMANIQLPHFGNSRYGAGFGN